MTRASDTRSLPVYSAGAIEVPFVIGGGGEVIERDTLWEAHSHPTHELIWNERGASSGTVGARVWTITPSAGLWVPAGVLHSGWTPAGTWQRAAHFSVREVAPISDEAVAVEITPLLRMLLDRLNTGGLEPASRATTEALVLDILKPSARELLLRMPESALLRPIVAAVQTDPAVATTLEEWADRLGVSARTITRTFLAETTLGFRQWVAMARAQRAIALLAHGEQLDEVAAQVGYRSTTAFGTAFRRVTGMTPGRFRLQ